MKITTTVIAKMIITKTEKEKYRYLLEVFHCTPHQEMTSKQKRKENKRIR